MFRRIEVAVDVGERTIFRFPAPLSVESLLVANAAEKILWEFIAAEYQPVEISGGSFRVWPLAEAPPELVAMIEHLQERADQEVAEYGPRKPPLNEITYGTLPDGYREKHAASPLAPGEYNVLVFAQQGQGSARFVVPDAREKVAYLAERLAQTSDPAEQQRLKEELARLTFGD